MTSQLTVLGSCGAWPEPGRACSGYLLEHDGYRVALDLGYGTLPALLELLDSVHADGLDAIVVTHEHPDHAIDLHGLFRARWFGRRDGPRIPLYAGAGVLDAVARIEQDDVNTIGASSTGTCCQRRPTRSDRSGCPAGRCHTSSRMRGYA